MDINLNSLKSIKHLEQNFNSLQSTHLRTLLTDQSRNEKLKIQTPTILFDFTHEKINEDTLKYLSLLSEETQIKNQFTQMFSGEKINTTENQSVLHIALRKDKNESFYLDGVDIIKQVHEVLEKIKTFSSNVRNGEFKGFSGKKIKNVISLGIGGSYLGIELIYNALKSHCEYEKLSKDIELRFIANVCPIDFYRAIKGLNCEETLFIIISKTFTTSETLLNARNSRNWLIEEYKAKFPSITNEDIKSIISHHFCAVTSNFKLTEQFGIDQHNVFCFWDWVGGRYSVWSAVGALPISIVFSYDVFEKFLQGGRLIDDTIQNCTDITKNIPIMLGLLGFYNTYIAKLNIRAVLPYSQALKQFVSYIQQLDMESNGKKVNKFTNEFVDYECGPIVFGDSGTNGQHSFYQLIHQGRQIATEFIGYAKPQFDCKYKGETVSSHTELMLNFFAQPDALAYGRFTEEDLKDVPKEFKKHKTFKGDRSSLSIILKELDAFNLGQLVAIYEHRVATEGFIYRINSFDQWGVELGKTLSKGLREVITCEEKDKIKEKYKEKLNSGTLGLIQFFVDNQK